MAFAVGRLHGEVSEYLHFLGIPNEAISRPEWFLQAITTLEAGANYIWHHITSTRTGQVNVASMPPSIRDTWEDYRTGRIDEDSVRTRLQIAQPILRLSKDNRLDNIWP